MGEAAALWLRVDFAGILGKEICVGAMTIHFHDRTATAGLPLEGGNRWVSEDALALGEAWGNSETLGDALANGEDDGGDGIEDRLESGIAVHTAGGGAGGKEGDVHPGEGLLGHFLHRIGRPFEVQRLAHRAG